MPVDVASGKCPRTSSATERFPARGGRRDPAVGAGRGYGGGPLMRCRHRSATALASGSVCICSTVIVSGSCDNHTRRSSSDSRSSAASSVQERASGVTLNPADARNHAPISEDSSFESVHPASSSSPMMEAEENQRRVV